VATNWLKRQPSVRSSVNDELDQHIERVYAQHNRCYSYRRVREELLDLGLAKQLNQTSLTSVSVLS
jgi:hypothetical protein